MFTTRYRAKIIANVYKDYLKSDDKILDIGCGNGIVTRYLIDHLNLDIWGTDIQEYLKELIPFQKMISNRELPFKNDSFDWALFNDVLHHSQEIPILIREGLRVAERVLIFEVKPSLIAKIIDKGINFFHNKKMPVPLNFLNFAEWEELLKKLNCCYKIIKLKKPYWFYPLSNFLIVIERR